MEIKEIKLPDLGEGITEGEIVKINVSAGDSISMDQVLLEVMTDKASMEVPSSVEGTVKQVKTKPGDMVAVGEVILTLESKTASTSKIDSIKSNSALSEPNPNQKNLSQNKLLETTAVKTAFKGINQSSDSCSTLAIPATRKLAQELGISLEEVSKDGSKITREDLIQHIKKTKITSHNGSPKIVAKKLQIEGGEVKRESLIGIKRLMLESMTLSKATIPHFTILESADVKHLVSVRTKLKERLKPSGVKLSYLPFIMKAVLSCLKEFPIFNSSYDSDTKEIVYKKSCHLGFAADSPQGLLVPVIKNAESKSVLEIAKQIQSLAKQTKDSTIKTENLKNASITITNIGSIGGLYGTPIINPPEMAILGVYRIDKKIVKNLAGEFEERDFMNFSLTCDHRFIDGATATRFLKSFVSKMEEPSLLILD